MQTGTLGVRAGMTAISEFDDFYRTHRADAVRWAAALVGSPEIGEEIAQDALHAVGRRLSTLDTRQSCRLPTTHSREPGCLVAPLAHS